MIQFRSHSLPISGGSSEEGVSRHKVLVSTLTRMGFKVSQVLVAIGLTRSESTEEILDFLTKGEHGWRHPFIPAEGNHVCVICEEGEDQHQELIFATREKFVRSTSNIQLTFSRTETIPSPLSDTVCPICLEEVLNKWRHPECAKHSFCEDCIKEYLKSKIGEGSEITCPGEGCKVRFLVQQLSELLGSDLVQKYEYFCTRAALHRDPDVKWCHSPDCQGFIRSSECDPNSPAPCPTCKLSLCVRCGDKYHAGLSCEQVVDNELEEWKRDKPVKRCPKCTWIIEKNEGCDHMTCISCRYEWCWLCLDKYSQGHYTPGSANYCAIYAAAHPELEPETNERMVKRCRPSDIPCIIFISFYILFMLPWYTIAFILFVPFMVPGMILRKSQLTGWKSTLAWIGLFIVCLILDPILALGFAFWTLYQLIVKGKRPFSTG